MAAARKHFPHPAAQKRPQSFSKTTAVVSENDRTRFRKRPHLFPPRL